jgi:hypothetical protein
LFAIPEGNLLLFLLVILSEAKNPRISPLLVPSRSIASDIFLAARRGQFQP